MITGSKVNASELDWQSQTQTFSEAGKANR